MTEMTYRATRRTAGVLLASALLILAACSRPEPPAASNERVTPTVQQANAAVAKAADLSDPASFADAKRGFIAAPAGRVLDDQGNVVWDYDAFAFVKGAAPPTVNPSLWRQALLNNQVGLYNKPTASAVQFNFRLTGSARRNSQAALGGFYFLPPKASKRPPTTMAPMPAHIGTLTVCFSFAEISTGPSLTTVVSFV